MPARLPARLLALAMAGLLLGIQAPAACGIPQEGFIVGWGRDDYGQASPPAGADFVAVDAGEYFNLALRADGSLAAWGWDWYGQVSGVPAGNDFTAISAGAGYGLALRTDGSIVGWGRNDFGEASPPAGNDFAALFAGGTFALALRTDNSIAAWGFNNLGQTDVPAGNDFMAIAAGWNHGLALRTDGSLVSWGYDWGGSVTGTPVEDDFVAIAAGGNHSLALRADGSMAAWGHNDYHAASPLPGSDFVAIAAGSYHNLALRADGSIAGWGRDNYGQTAVPAGNDFIAISGGEFHSVALVVGRPPGAFGKSVPTDGAQGQGADVALSWAASPGAASYEYCVDTSDDDACAGWADAGLATSAPVSGLADATTYFWQVRAVNPFGVTGADGGAWWSFATGPPGAFGKTSPPEGATGQSANPLLSWGAASGAGSFEYCVDATDDGACDGSWVSAGTGTSGQLTGLAYETTYFWQVRAVNSFGTTDADGGAWWSFTTKATPAVLEMSFRSVAAYDGWVLERADDSGKGGTYLGDAVTARVGDDEADRQYRSILHFDTSALPDDAVVVGITIGIKQESVTGTSPLPTHGKLKVDVKAGAFHNDAELERFDFHAMGSRGSVGRFLKAAVDGWYRAPLRAVAYPLVNLTGHTQFRLRFDLDDDDDGVADCLYFWTGDAPVAGDRPEVIVSYVIP